MKIEKRIENWDSKNWILNLLSAYGIQDVEKWLHASKSDFENANLYQNLKSGFELLNLNLKNKNKIGVLVDDDQDGICSATIVALFLKSQMANWIPFFHTVPKGHGLKNGGADNVLHEILESGIGLLIIPDASADNDATNRLYDNGISVLTLDHHNTMPTSKGVTINCTWQDGTNHHASGTLVTAKFIDAYCDEYGIPKIPNYDLVGLSIISDVVSLTAIENRAYVNEWMNNGTHNPFLQAVMTKFNAKGSINSHDIGWNVAPKSNACTRADDGTFKKDVFMAMCGEGDVDKTLKEMARCHRQQTDKTREIANSIQQDMVIGKNCVIGFIDAEDKSYTGLIAGRLSGEYNRPAFVLRELNSTQWSGSFRSPIELMDMLNDSRLINMSGHGAAAGCVVNKANLDRFIKWLNNQDLSTIVDAEIVTAELQPSDITLDLCEQVQSSSWLFGKDVDEPMFYCRLHVTPSDVAIFKKTTNTGRITLDGVNFIKFKMTDDEVNTLESGDDVDIEVIGTLSVNEYNDMKTPQMQISKWEIHTEQKQEENTFDWDGLFK